MNFRTPRPSKRALSVIPGIILLCALIVGVMVVSYEPPEPVIVRDISTGIAPDRPVNPGDPHNRSDGPDGGLDDRGTGATREQTVWWTPPPSPDGVVYHCLWRVDTGEWESAGGLWCVEARTP